jgi:GT2 family glycosyltransferase
MDLSIAIVSFNTRELTLACLRSIVEQTRAIDYEIILVDNMSCDGSAAAVAAAFPQVRLLCPGKNTGFAGGNNLAAPEARGEWILLLNPDTVVLDGAIQKALAFARGHQGVDIVGGRTFYGDGSLNYTSCHGRPTPWSLLCMGTGLSSVFRRSRLFNPESLGSWRRDSVRRVDAVTGCFFLTRRALWEELGGLDESFFMYGEETDFCLRAKHAGHECWICPEATLIHYGGASEAVRADKMVRLFRAKVQLFRKHWKTSHAGFGVAMLKCWALSRAVVLEAASTLWAGKRPAAEAWRQVWRRRGEWATVSRGAIDAPSAKGERFASPGIF